MRHGTNPMCIGWHKLFKLTGKKELETDEKGNILILSTETEIGSTEEKPSQDMWLLWNVVYS